MCVSKKIGLINEKGELQHDVIIEKSADVLGDKALADKLYGDCAGQKSKVEDTVFDSLKCYY